jgi:hypothetical protein
MPEEARRFNPSVKVMSEPDHQRHVAEPLKRDIDIDRMRIVAYEATTEVVRPSQARLGRSHRATARALGARC